MASGTKSTSNLGYMHFMTAASLKMSDEPKFFDNREQAEEYVKENIIPFDKTKSKSILLNYLKFMTSEIWMIFYLIVLSKSTRPTPFT